MKISKNLTWAIAIEIGVLYIIASFFIAGGDDLRRFYYPFANGCLECGYIPFYSQWLLFPMTFVDKILVYPLWTFITVIATLIICYFSKVNPLMVIASFPFFGQIWLGQIDIILAIGFALMFLNKNCFINSVGIFFILIKPQIAILPLIIFLIENKNWKVLILPSVLVLISFIQFGLFWPLDWIKSSSGLIIHTWRLASIDIWFFGIFFIWLPFIFKNKEQKFAMALLIAFLSNPFVSVYSYFLFLIFIKRHTILTFSLGYVWLLLFPFLGETAMRFAWVLPVGLCLLSFYYPIIKEEMWGDYNKPLLDYK